MAGVCFLELQDAELAKTFVGRDEQLDALNEALEVVATDPSAIRVVVVHGGAGIGKTSVARMAARVARERGFSVSYDDDDGGSAPRFVVLDGMQHGQWAEAADRRALFASLRPGGVYVLEVRPDPITTWAREPGWGTLILPIEVTRVTSREVTRYLERRGIDAAAHPELVRFADGHPLALGLLVDAQVRAGGTPVEVAENPDLIAALCDQFVTTVPDEEHGAALELATLLRMTTEDALAELVSRSRARELFRWLRSLSFMITSANGIHPHDLAREVLDRSYAWRNPRGRATFAERARAYVLSEFVNTDSDVFAAFGQLGHLVPLEAGARECVALPPDFPAVPVPARPEHLPVMREMTLRHEGELSAQLLDRWFARAPQGFRVLETPRGEVLGFVAIVFLDRIAPDELADDPMLVTARRIAESMFRGVITGRVSLVRFWIGRDAYQAPGPVVAALSAITVNGVLADGVAISLNYCTDPMTLAGTRDAVGILTFGQVQIGTLTTTMMGLDRRGMTPEEWMESIPIFTRSRRAALPEGEGARLDRDVFDRAVRDALRDLHRREKLALNPLTSTPLVAGGGDPANALRKVVVDGLAAIGGSYGRAIRAAYGEPGRSHEDAAEALGMPYSTFRRHVARGISDLVEELWRQEAAPRPRG